MVGLRSPALHAAAIHTPRLPSLRTRHHAHSYSAVHSKGHNYQHVGDSEPEPGSLAHLQRGWAIDHARVRVGSGRDAYRRAAGALRSWGHFRLPWAWVAGRPGVAPGQGVAVVARSLCMWTCNPLRVVYSGERSGELPPAAREQQRQPAGRRRGGGIGVAGLAELPSEQQQQQQPRRMKGAR